jgi:hypothetical protein
MTPLAPTPSDQPSRLLLERQLVSFHYLWYFRSFNWIGIDSGKVIKIAAWFSELLQYTD